MLQRFKSSVYEGCRMERVRSKQAWLSSIGYLKGEGRESDEDGRLVINPTGGVRKGQRGEKNRSLRTVPLHDGKKFDDDF